MATEPPTEPIDKLAAERAAERRERDEAIEREHQVIDRLAQHLASANRRTE